MVDVRIGKGHGVRKALFELGLRRGYLTFEEVEKSLPLGPLTPAEQWLLYYSLRAAEIELLESDEAKLEELVEGSLSAPESPMS